MRATNCNDCGCLPCCCVTNTNGAEPQSRESCNERHVVHESVGDCVPLQPDPLKIISGDCCPPQGGDMTIQAPKYFLTVENPPDDVLRDENGNPILDANGNVVAINQ